MLRASVKKFVCKLVGSMEAAVAGNRPFSPPLLEFWQKVVKLLRKVFINFLLRVKERSGLLPAYIYSAAGGV